MTILNMFFTNNHIEKKQCFNRGELPQYFVAEDHEPIIDREIFDAVQAEIARRAAMYTVAGRKVAEDAEDDMAELIQHEYDHLDGILATMRAIDRKSFVMKKH